MNNLISTFRGLYIYNICVSLFMLFFSYMAGAENIKFVETTGRAVITDEESINNARRNALEDAIFLAAIHGGAQIDGFTSVDMETNLTDHFTVRPAGELLDYTILEESIESDHYQTTIRAAVGKLGTIECSKRSAIKITKYGAEFNFSSKVPAWLRQIGKELETDLGSLLDEHEGTTLVPVSPIKLNVNKLLNTNDAFDYTAITRGNIRIKTGDFALVPSISMQIRKSAKNIETEIFLLVSVNSQLYEGEDYKLLESVTYDSMIKLKSETPWRSFDILSKKTRDQIQLSIKNGLKAHVAELMDKVQCIPLSAKIKLRDKKLVVDLGHSHGINPTSLAISSGTNTPYSILHVTEVLANQSVIEPLNKSLEITSLIGKTINFME